MADLKTLQEKEAQMPPKQGTSWTIQMLHDRKADTDIVLALERLKELIFDPIQNRNKRTDGMTNTQRVFGAKPFISVGLLIQVKNLAPPEQVVDGLF